MKIVLAGAEKHMWKLIKMGAPNVLLSYYYMRDMGAGAKKALEEAKDAGMWVLVDSGAYTFLQQYKYNVQHEFTHAEMVRDLRANHKAHVEWIGEHAHLIDAYAELDLDQLVGEEEIWEWRENYRKAGGKAEIIVTPHDNFLDQVDQFAKRGYTYMGAGAGNDDATLSQLFSHPKLRESRMRVHGWAKTDWKSIAIWPYYSVDSSSWLAGAEYGDTFKYLGNRKMRVFDNKRKTIRQQWVRDFEELGINEEDILADKDWAVDQWNCSQWVKYAEDMVEYNTNAYWLTADERSESTALARNEYRTDQAIIRHDASAVVDVRDHPTQEFGRYCSTCYLASKCPVYEKDTTCTMMANVSITNTTGLRDALGMLLEKQTERALFAMLAERVLGVGADPLVSAELERTFDLALKTKKVFDDRDEVTVTAKGTGLISRLFGGFGKAGQAKPSERVPDAPEPIDITPEAGE